ncbi:MAG: double-strand break repair helicase AddA [Alphaproteobacteria bacterium]|nr:double-strand break repair helicase AddA [Alphaproteobacteria bacterium]
MDFNKDQCQKERCNLSAIAGNQQREAANPAYSVWVEASAGTGKTKVLTDRLLRLLLSGVEPQRLLCLTYTKAAAVQMNERISAYLSKWAVMSDDKLCEDIEKLMGASLNLQNKDQYIHRSRVLFAKLLDTPGGIKIQTIHSFCQDILKRFPLEAKISPYFEVLDDRGRDEVLRRIKKDLLVGEIIKTPEIKNAVEYFTHNLSEYSFPKVLNQITDNRAIIEELLEKYGNLQGFLPVLAEHLETGDNDNENAVKLDFMRTVNRDDVKKNIAAWSQGGKTDMDKCDKLAQIFSHEPTVADYETYKTVFLTAKGQPLSERYMAGKNAQKADAEILDRAYKEAARLQKTNQKLDKIRLYQSTKYFLTVAEELNGKYREYKEKNAVSDYDDLILLTRRLLSNQTTALWVLYKLDGGIDHILLDEAQDTSPEQWDIIKYLSEEFFAGVGVGDRNKTVFAVGDRKQSIFSFQGADPKKFDAMSKYFSDKAGSNFKKVNLEVSFRSAPAILQAVNKVFADSDTAQGVVSADEKVNHKPFRVGEFGHVEIWAPFIADKENKIQDDSQLLPPMEMCRRSSARTKLAVSIAERIKTMVTETFQTDHPLNFRDFMVLVRKRDAFVEEFIRACKNLHVEISGADKMVLTEQIAVQDLISLGKFLLLPNDDLSLAEVLKSPLFGLDDDDLMQLCWNRKKALLWSRLGDNPKYAKIYEQLQTLLNKLDYIRPYELYNFVLTKMNGRQHFIERMGLEVEDALDEFMNLTIAFEQKNTPSLQEFIEWMEQSDVVIKRQTEQKEINAVRLMTVHGSKGLQAPVVFLPDTISVKSSKCEQNLLFDDKYAYYPLSGDSYDDNCLSIKQNNDEKADEEYRRLLYVALTRAEDQLIICGYANSDKINEKSWFSLCEKSLMENGFPEDKIFKITSQEVIKKNTENMQIIPDNLPEIPDWLNKNVSVEDAMSKPYTPSNLETEDEEPDSVSPLRENGNFYRRGTLIHKLLQFLPQNTGNLDMATDIFLQKNASDFSPYQLMQIKNEVLTLINNPDYAPLFGSEAQSEVPVIGEIEGKMVSAQLDKLLVLPDKIMIVDFKTNRPPAQTVEDTPLSYIRQLSLYAELIRRIYPNLPIETYILWTNEARLMRVS